MTLSSVPDHSLRYISPLTCAPALVKVGRCPGRSRLPEHLPGNRPACLPRQTPADTAEGCPDHLAAYGVGRDESGRTVRHYTVISPESSFLAGHPRPLTPRVASLTGLPPRNTPPNPGSNSTHGGRGQFVISAPGCRPCGLAGERAPFTYRNPANRPHLHAQYSDRYLPVSSPAASPRMIGPSPA